MRWEKMTRNVDGKKMFQNENTRLKKSISFSKFKDDDVAWFFVVVVEMRARR